MKNKLLEELDLNEFREELERLEYELDKIFRVSHNPNGNE